MKREIGIMMVTITVAILFLVPSKGKTITVDLNGSGDFTSIQKAVNSADNGDTIFIKSGIYEENIIIENKSINVVGENRENTIIKGLEDGHVISIIYANGVNISELTIQDPKGSGYDCLFLSDSENLTISRCNIKSSGSDGITICRCKFSTISGCTIENNANGRGILMMHSCNNIIRNNEIRTNQIGIFLQLQSSENIIYGNTIEKNSLYGLRIIFQSSENLIFENVFRNNGQNAEDICSNQWYNSEIKSGNYWDDYKGEDLNNDGIGDKPYYIPGGNNKDIYVLGFFTEQENPPANKKPVANAGDEYFGEVNVSVKFDGSKSYDQDGEIVDYIWNFGDGSSGRGKIVYHSYLYPGNYTVTLRVVDNEGAEDMDTAIVHIFKKIENIPPVPIINSKDYGIVGESITFDASYSYDLDGNIIKYVWDFGDGKADYGKIVNHSYLNPGIYNVTLEVIDNKGFTNSTWKLIEILTEESIRINAEISIDTEVLMAGSEITFDASQSKGKILYYIWDFGDGNKLNTTSPICKHIYKKEGTYYVHLTVVGINGESNETYTTVVVKGVWKKSTPGFEIILIILSFLIICGSRMRK